MANIRVSYTDMEQAASQLALSRDEITARLRLMESQISNLVSTGFVTEQASVRFNASYSEYTVGASTVIEKLSEIQAFLVQTAASLRDFDAQLAARIA